MEVYKPNLFIFSPRYLLWRHVLFWLVNCLMMGIIWQKQFSTLYQNIFSNGIWVPIYIIYSYPLIYWVYPSYLLTGKYLKFALIMVIWVVAGWFLNFAFRMYIFIPLQEYQHMSPVNKNPWQQGTYMSMIATTGAISVITILRYWIIKQGDLLQTQREKLSAELQLLKARAHPNFLFHSLQDIYNLSLLGSSKTPRLILKLSSLLSYMLYDCKSDEVLLETEIEAMKNYLDLENEHYGNRTETSLNIEGDIKNKNIAPLLLLPFLENAFKQGTPDLLEKSWLSFDLTVKRDVMRCKIVNSKANLPWHHKNGIGIDNVKKRLDFIYPGKYELNINNEGDFFVAFLSIALHD